VLEHLGYSGGATHPALVTGPSKLGPSWARGALEEVPKKVARDEQLGKGDPTSETRCGVPSAVGIAGGSSPPPPGDTVRPPATAPARRLFKHPGRTENLPRPGSPFADETCSTPFAGTGALGIEGAVARGIAPPALYRRPTGPRCSALRRNLAVLDEEAAPTSSPANATRPPRAPYACALAFLGSAPTAAASARAGTDGACGDGAWLVAVRRRPSVEIAAGEEFFPPDGFTMNRRAQVRRRQTPLSPPRGAAR